MLDLESIIIAQKLTGGCLCESIRYEVDKVFDSGYCHCSMCRKLSGAPVLVWGVVKAPYFRLVKGTPTEYASSENGIRGFVRLVVRNCSTETKHPMILKLIWVL